MLRINLLPEHFAQAQVARRMMLFFAGLIVLVVLAWLLAPGVGWVSMSRRIADVQEQYEGKNPEKWPDMPEGGYKAEGDRVRGIEEETQDLINQRAPYGVRVEFIRALAQVPQQYVEALAGIEPYIYENARITSLSLAGATVTMQVVTPTTSDAGRFYLNIMRCPALSDVTVQVGTGGGPVGGPGVGAPAGGGLIPVSVTATLVKPIPVPGTPGAAAGAGAPGAAGAPPGVPTRPTPSTVPGAGPGGAPPPAAGAGNTPR